MFKAFVLATVLMSHIQLSTADFDYRMSQLNRWIIPAEITAYNEYDGRTPGTIMANGEEVHYGAVANDQLPLGTLVEIDGEIFKVCDRFGAGHPIERFDMYLPSRGDCDRWGRQKKEVKVLKE